MIETPSFTANDIERGALSSILQSSTAATEAMGVLTPEHFSNPANRIMFTELAAMWEQGEPIDLLLFTHWLGKRKLLNMVGGAPEVTAVYLHVPSAVNVKYYVSILDDERDNKRIADTCRGAADAAEAGEADVLPSTLSKLADIPKRRDERTLKEGFIAKLYRMEAGEPDDDIIKTGLIDLDNKSPLRKGDMPLIAGERKAGKSILALTIALNVARNGVPVLYFSLEDREPKVIDRLFAGITRIPIDAHHIKKMTDVQSLRASAAMGKMDLPIRIRDDIYELHSIIALTRQSVAQGTAGLVVIDYAQLVRAKAESRREEVEKVSRDIRLMAMELNIPVLLLCQLNKEKESRESKALEMDATAMWRIDTVSEEETGQRIIAVPWQRNGESGLVFKVAFLGNIARVENMGRDCAVPEGCG